MARKLEKVQPPDDINLRKLSPAVVFCLGCEQVLDIAQYLSGKHRCVSKARHPGGGGESPAAS